MGNRCKIVPSIANKLKSTIDAEGIDNIESQYKALKKNAANQYNFSEDQLNQLGYHYLGNDKVDFAVAIFKINVDAFPKSFNVYDSYGEALLKGGDKEKAIQNYQLSSNRRFRRIAPLRGSQRPSDRRKRGLAST